MANIENLTGKILEEAREKQKEIIASANLEGEKILSKKLQEAEEIKKVILDKAKEESKSRKERIISNALLKVRNEKLAVKQKVMDEVFEKALEELCNMNSDAFKNYFKESILNLDITGDEVVILNEPNKKVIEQDFINEINNMLKARGKKDGLTISSEVGNFKGGYILEKNGVEINNTFEALISSKKDELEYEVANLLFN
ncbi:V-type ATP synthase subunit E [Clostridium paridis]|uniref:V-type proton ATPase subunit E n=1 Tax=Clostridium paridis TaxID=2803863 RepID=A0A937K3F4_9CLOT|nr:V-type ATP synthase subunit E [Clostridium paridis]MBL4932351.1 V-type ATP synthase subunit E [Clostridium paridis]